MNSVTKEIICLPLIDIGTCGLRAIHGSLKNWTASDEVVLGTKLMVL